MKTRIVLLFLLSILSASAVYSQRITETVQFYPAVSYDVKQITVGSDNPTYEFGYNTMGYLQDSVLVNGVYKKRKNIYRSIFSLNLGSLKRNTTVKSVRIWYSCPGYDHTFKLTNVSTYPNSYSAAWSTAGNSSSLVTGAVYGSATIQSNPALVSWVQNAVTNGNLLYIGAVSEKETTSGSVTDLTLSLIIEYERDLYYNVNTVQNDMDGYNGGTISVNNVAKVSPAIDTVKENQSRNYAVLEPQIHSQSGINYNYVYNDTEGNLDKSQWTKNGAPIQNSPQQITVLFLRDDNATYTALLKRTLNVSITNEFAAGQTGGYVTVNLASSTGTPNTSISTPGAVPIVYQNGMTVYAPGQAWGTSLWAVFEKWSDNYSSALRAITPSGHESYTAYYKLKPTNDYRNLTFNSTIGDPVTLNWNEHPSQNVTSYKIFRRLNSESSPTQIATVNRGTTEYIDYDYAISENMGPNSRIYYDVRAVYNGTLPDNTSYTTEADEAFVMQFGIIPPKVDDDNKDKIFASNVVPSEYTFGAYPNPFNPTTVIRYQLPEAGFVSIKVYNLLSQEVASLVEEVKGAGIHTVNFNAGNLPSGIYIARLQAGSKVMSQKLQLIK